MEEKIWYFICTRKHKSTPNVEIAFKVYAYNIIQASYKAWERILKDANKCAEIRNFECDGNPYEVIENENKLIVCLNDTRKSFVDGQVFTYADFELINEQEYESLPKEVWKDYM